MRLAGRVVIVTGAGQGLGRAYARALAREGARLALCDLADPTAVVDEIVSAGGQAMSAKADVTDGRAVRAFVAAAVARFGTVHALVNNAGISSTLKRRPFTEIPSAEWDHILAVNARGPFECAKAVVPIMRDQRYGKIVNVASGTMFKGTVGLMAYVASKGAVVAMTRVMARELGEYNICVNAIAPGNTEIEHASDDLVAMRGPTIASRSIQRPERPDDLIGALTFFCSAESDFVTGQTLVIDGGAVFN